MSIYDNETKIFPDLNPTAPQVPQTYQLQKLTEIEAYLLMKLRSAGGIPNKGNDLIQS